MSVSVVYVLFLFIFLESSFKMDPAMGYYKYIYIYTIFLNLIPC